MNEIQLELNVENRSESEIKLDMMQKQIEAIADSTGKVRRKLFAEMTEIKKACLALRLENQDLKDKLRSSSNEKVEWLYAKDEHLFILKESQIAEAISA